MRKENRVQEQYNKMAENYDRRWHGYVDSTLSLVMGQVWLQGGESILDVACGTGALEERLIKQYPGVRITGIDIAEKMLAKAREKVAGYPQVAFIRAGSSELPFGDMSFDLVVSANAFHFFDHPESSLREMHRVLKLGGRVIIVDWCKDYLICRICDVFLKIFDPAYNQCYTQEELRSYIEKASLGIVWERRCLVGGVWGMMLVEAVKR